MIGKTGQATVSLILLVQMALFMHPQASAHAK